MRTIQLDASDDIITILDRLSWAQDIRVALVLPEDGGVLREEVDLVRLRRFADRQRIEVGLVVADLELGREARAFGIPTFLTVEQAEGSRRGWVRGRKRRDAAARGVATVGGFNVLPRQAPRPVDEADLDEMYRRMTPPSNRRKWLLRYVGILLFCVTVGLLVVSAVMGIPGATITFQPQTVPLAVERQIVADPLLAGDTRSGASVPGRVLEVEQVLNASVATSGSAEIANGRATGTILFANRLDQPVTVPPGTRVSTTDGSTVVFQTTESVDVPAGVGATAEVAIAAIEPGPAGNVAASRINRIEGALATQLDAINVTETEGGSTELVSAVAEADFARLRAQLMDAVVANALHEMESQLDGAEFLAQDSVRVDVVSETFSHFEGEQAAEVALELRAVVAATAVDTTEATDLLYTALGEALPVDHTLVPGSLRFSSGEVLGVDEQGRVTFTMRGEGDAAPELVLSPLLETVAGHEVVSAERYLDQQLPLEAPPTIRVWPSWLGRVPYLPSRIQTQIEY